MTIQTTNIDATTGDAVDLTPASEVFYTIETNVVLESQFANGVVAESGQSSFIYNNGAIVANGDGVILENSNDHFYNEPTGTVFGFRGVELTTTGETFVNYGAVSGDVYGAEDVAGNNIISNFGMIEGPTAGFNIAAGGDTITNATTGTIGGGIAIVSGGQTIDNAGAIDGSITFAGTANSNSNTIVNDGTITGAGGTAITLGSGLDTVVLGKTSVLDGNITNFATGDIIDLQGLQFNGTKYSGGVLTLLENGSQVGQLGILTPYSSPVFLVSADGSGGTDIVAGNPGPPAATTAVMIMSQSSTGNYEIYDLGNNAVLAADPLTNIPAASQVVGLGNFSGSDTSDMLLRNSSTGAFEIVDVANNNAGAPIPSVTVGLNWTVAGFGDFSSRPGETDMLLRDSNTGSFEVYDISNNMVTSATPLGAVGMQEQVLGFGDFSGRANETDMLLRDSGTGNVMLYDIGNNMVTSAATVGTIGLNFQFAGVGDFSGRAGETDLMMRDSTTGNFVVYDFQNGAITSTTSLGAVGLQMAVAGFGNLSGNANETDMMLRNTSTGAFSIYDISNNQVTGVHSVGAVGLTWTVAGIANDPPSSAAPSSGAPIASDQVQGQLASSAASDPAGPGSWLSQPQQTPQGGVDGWLTQAMAGTSLASGPGFDSGSGLTAGTMPVTALALSNPLQTHST